MFNDDSRNQKIATGDSSCNIQLSNSNIVLQQSSLSYEDVKSICKDLIDDNFTKMRAEALEVLNGRIDEFITLFLPIIDVNNPLHVRNFRTPSMQHAIYLAQQSYVLNSDVNQEYLIDLLQEKLNTNDDELKQILLSEAIDKLRLITSNQIEALRILLEMTFMRPKNRNLEDVISYYDRLVKELQRLSISDMDISHILYTGCVFSYGIGIRDFSGLFGLAIETNNLKLNENNDYDNYIDGSCSLKEMKIVWNNHPLSSLGLNSVGKIIALSQWNLRNRENKLMYDCLF